MNVVLFGLLAAIFAPFALSVWVAYVRHPAIPANEVAVPEEIAVFALTRATVAAEAVDLEPAVRVVAQTLHDQAKTSSVRIELAVDPGSKAWVDPNTLASALRAIVLTAIHATPGGQVLVTGTTFAGQSHIRVTDDGRDTDQRTREGLVRCAEELIALQGGSVGVEVRRDRATTVTIRLPMPGDRSAEPNEMPAMAEEAA